MKIKQRYDGLSIPTWALCYLINADGEGLSDEDRDTVDRWVHSFLPGAFLISVEDGEFLPAPLSSAWRAPASKGAS